ncbi:UNVERIFIED_CONTAM: hypothetical protein NCL1_11953 [Trichonephila clavipes]
MEIRYRLLPFSKTFSGAITI